MQSRFAGAITKWLGIRDAQSLPPQEELPYISSFSFNHSTSISITFKTQLNFSKEKDGPLILHIPSFVPVLLLNAPEGTVEAKFTFVAVNCDAENQSLQGSLGDNIVIPFNTNPLPAQSIPFAVPPGSGYVLLTALLIEFTGLSGIRYKIYP